MVPLTLRAHELRLGRHAPLTAFVVSLIVATSGLGHADPADLDDTFSGDGVVRTNVSPGVDIAFAIAVQADGKLVAAGMASRQGNARLALARYNSDGTLDDTFGGDGKVETDLGPRDDIAFDVTVDADGRIVAAGRTGGSGGRFAVVRYLEDGSLDPSFAGDGVAKTNLTRLDDGASGLAIQPNGKIVVVGRAREGFENFGRPTDSGFGVVRYLPDGIPDPSFGGDGKILTNPTPRPDHALDVAVTTDGRIVAVGRGGGSGGRFALVRYLRGGRRDGTFGGDGIVFTDLGPLDDFAGAVAIQGDGKVVASGTTGRRSGSHGFALARYQANGSLDSTFSGDGTVLTRFEEYFTESGNLGDIASAVAIQADERIVAAGSSHRSVLLGVCCDRFTVVARYLPTGILDDTFSGDGKAVDEIGESHGANDMALQADGRIVTAGEAFVGNDRPAGRFLLLRYVTS